MFFFINFSNYISLYQLLYRSFNYNIYRYFNLSINRNWSFNNNLNFLFYKSLINNSLLSSIVYIHISSSFKIAWSYLSILKSCLSYIHILTIFYTSINFIRLTLSNFYNNSLSFSNLYNFRLSLHLGNNFWITLSNLRNSKFFLSLVKIRWSVIGIRIISRNQSILRLVIMRLVITLNSLIRDSVLVNLILLLSNLSIWRLGFWSYILTPLLYLLIALHSTIRSIWWLLIISNHILIHYKIQIFSFLILLYFLKLNLN
jgi:hypothetical protein